MNTLLYDGSSGRVPISSEKLILINPVLFMAFAIIAAPFTPLAHAQNTITGSVTHAVRGSKPARLSVAALCAQLTLDEVTAIMGDNFERRPESEGKPQVCEYSDRLEKGKMKVRCNYSGGIPRRDAS